MADSSVSVLTKTSPGAGEANVAVDSRTQPGGDHRQVVCIGDESATSVATVGTNGLHVDVRAAVLPTGGATSAKQDDQTTALTAITGYVDGLESTSTAIATATGAPADASATSDTGTFSIVALLKRALGKLTSILAAIPTLGQGTMAQSMPVTVASNQSAVPVSGSVAVSNLPATQPVSGTVSAAQVATTGATCSNVASSTASVSLREANTSRRAALVFNDSTAALYLKFGATASATSYTVQIAAGGFYELPQPIYTGVLDGIWAAANGAARVTEVV